VTSPTSEIMTASEADERWGLHKGAVRQSCVRGQLKKYIEQGLVRKSGGTWLVTVEAMEAVFGPEKKEDE